MENKVICIFSADWHLSLKPPIARSVEKSWLDAQLRPINEIKQLQNEHNNIPVIIAGDVLHHWDEKAELINWILQNSGKNWWAIRGQHDTPHHQVRDMNKSAFQTLIHAEILNPLKSFTGPGMTYGKFGFYGYSWKEPFFKPITKNGINVAIVHQYIWSSTNNCFKNAPKSGHVTRLFKELKDYQIIITGDNHLPFQATMGKQTLFNCGSLTSRNIDQKDYKPSVGLLYEDGTIKRHYLDISQDKWLDSKRIKTKSKKDLSSLLKELKNIDVKAVDFREQLKVACKSKKVSKETREMLFSILEEVH